MKVLHVLLYNRYIGLLVSLSFMSIIATGIMAEANQLVGAIIAAVIAVGTLVGAFIVYHSFTQKYAMFRKCEVEGFVVSLTGYRNKTLRVQEYFIEVAYEFEGTEYRLKRTIGGFIIERLMIEEGKLVRIGVNKYNPKQAMILDLYE